jgi:hypothetical protein
MTHEEEARAKLTAAWRAAGKRLLDEGYSPADVTDTMLAVALASWSGLRDRDSAARHLRAVANHLLADETEQPPKTGAAA